MMHRVPVPPNPVFPPCDSAVSVFVAGGPLDLLPIHRSTTLTAPAPVHNLTAVINDSRRMDQLPHTPDNLSSAPLFSSLWTSTGRQIRPHEFVFRVTHPYANPSAMQQTDRSFDNNQNYYHHAGTSTPTFLPIPLQAELEGFKLVLPSVCVVGNLMTARPYTLILGDHLRQ